jgi:2-dehydro-3-deoxyphosphogluconate aldolase/(4S)-4-hydroxy-2-oxoglutarate aldolase
VKDDLIKSGNFAEITRLTREAVRVMLNFQLAHVGLNMPDAASAQKTARDIGALFDWPPNPVPGGVFAGTAVEVKENGRGQHGHIAVSTRSLRRALAFLSRRGVSVDKSTLPAEGKSAGPVYLNGEWGGFALHLIEKA